jgi:hypothetical protein
MGGPGAAPGYMFDDTSAGHLVFLEVGSRDYQWTLDGTAWYEERRHERYTKRPEGHETRSKGLRGWPRERCPDPRPATR